MENNKILEKTREALEEHIQLIVRKGGNMTPPDIEILTKDLCALETLKHIEQNEDSQNSYQASGKRGRAANGRFVSRDGGSSNHYDDSEYYGDGSNSARSHNSGSSSRYYDGGSGNSGYSGHSRNDMTIYHIENLIDAAQTEQERQFLSEWLRRVKNN